MDPSQVASTSTLTSVSPASGEPLGRFPVAGGPEIAQALAAAQVAAGWWHALGFAGRRKRLLSFAALLTKRMDELADLVHRETGKPPADAIIEIVAAIGHLSWSARHARKVLHSRRVSAGLLQFEHSARLEYHPYGVIGVIGPWNYPVFTPIGVISGALAAGNAVIFKPSEYTPAVGQTLRDWFAETVPEQPVLQTVHGYGATGAALCRSGVRKIAFTGSTATGKQVMATCAETLTPVVLECGGKDVMIVAEDADLRGAAQACTWAAMANAGQTCVGIERVYVVQQIYQPFLAELTAQVRRLRVGPDPRSDLGPITTPQQAEIIRTQLADALVRGARALTGPAAGDLEYPDPGSGYVMPTVLVDVPEEALVCQRETFGPVVTVHPVASVEQALGMVNAGNYGLGGAVFTGNRKRGLDLARQIRSGMTSVNGVLTFAAAPGVPSGGVGESGFGRVHGAAGLREFTWPKAIVSRRFPSPIPIMTFVRKPGSLRVVKRIVEILYGFGRDTPSTLTNIRGATTWNAHSADQGGSPSGERERGQQGNQRDQQQPSAWRG